MQERRFVPASFVVAGRFAVPPFTPSAMPLGSRRQDRGWRSLVLLLTVILFAAAAAAQEEGIVNVTDVAKWRTEKVLLADGRAISGLVRYETSKFVEIVEVGWKPGVPMYLLVRWVPRSNIKRIERLDDSLRRDLEKKIARFRNRTRIAAAKIQEVELSTGKIQATKCLVYEGPWFSLSSTADELLTREAIVRLEQVIAGFRTFIRPRKQPKQSLHIVVLGQLDQYLEYQKLSNLNVRNPAYFDPDRNEIVAGGQLASFAAKLNETRAHHNKLLDRYARQQDEMRQKLQALTRRLRASGASDEESRKVRDAARAQWNKIVESQELKIRIAERENERQYHEQFRVLYHEAFHAYLQSYVFDTARYNIPRWLNEGLAQVFEAGMLDAGTLRLDAPNEKALRELQIDLRRGRVLSIDELLQSRAETFLVAHNDSAGRANRLYLHSWGVAYYLTFQLQLLDSPGLDRYLDSTIGPNDQTRRFEKMTGMPIERFQQEWRRFVLKLESNVTESVP